MEGQTMSNKQIANVANAAFAASARVANDANVYKTLHLLCTNALTNEHDETIDHETDCQRRGTPVMRGVLGRSALGGGR